MAILRRVKFENFTEKEMKDIPTLDMAGNIAEEPVGFEPKSYQQILQEMICMFSTHAGPNADIRPGSVICTFFEVVAHQIHAMQQAVAQQTWTFPDGTKGTTKPKDGATFRMNSSAGEECYMWDGYLEQWKWIGRKLNTSVDFAPIKIEINDVKTLKCECGSDKVGSPKHSSWCDKYDPNV